MKKFKNFLGRGTAPETPPPCRLRRLDSRVFGARPATPNVPVALTPMCGSGHFEDNCKLHRIDLPSCTVVVFVFFRKIIAVELPYLLLVVKDTTQQC